MTFWTTLVPLSWVVAAFGAAAVLWAATVPLVGAPELAIPAGIESIDELRSPYRADTLVAVVVARDVFRQARSEPRAAYDPAAAREQAIMPYEDIPRPILRLVGFVNATEPTALIEGFPERPGACVVREGDVIAGLSIKSLRDGRVEVVGMDTVWVLTVREPWH